MGSKLSAVVSDLLGESSRAMPEALIAGERDPLVPAEMATAGMRTKREILAQTLTGRFTDHHEFLARTMLDRTDTVTATETRLSEENMRHLAVRRGERRALAAVGHTVLTSVWYMLTNDAGHAELGGDYFIRRTGWAGQPRRLASRLDMLGHQVSFPSGEAV